MVTFEQWLAGQGVGEQLAGLGIVSAFEVMVARLDGARAAGAVDPMRAISTRQAGPNSRKATHRMLEQLGYDPAQRRIVHRLLVGSPSGWPGLLRLFATGANLSPRHRHYLARQASAFGHGSAREQARV